MCLIHERKWYLYRVPPEVVFASREINTSENKAKDTRTSGNQGRFLYEIENFQGSYIGY
jgi:hypothetical protein